MRQRSSARSAPSCRQDMYVETPSVATWRSRSAARSSILRGDRALGVGHVAHLLVDVVGRLVGGRGAARVRLGLEQIAVRDDGDERRLGAVRAPEFLVDPLERVEIGVDGGVDLARLGHEDDDVGRLRAELDGDRLERAAAVVVLGGRRPLLQAARVEDRHRPALALVVVPAAAPGLRRHVPELGHLRAEERVDERRLARAAPPHEDERGRPLLEQHRAQRRDPHAQVPGHLEREAIEQLFEAGDRARQRLQGVVLGSAIPATLVSHAACAPAPAATTSPSPW